MILSNKAVKLLNEKLAGHIAPVYETDYNLKPIRRQDKFLCRGKIIRLQPSTASIRVQSDKRPDVKTDYGYLCLIAVMATSANHKNWLGKELIFNIANEDIEAILVEK